MVISLSVVGLPTVIELRIVKSRHAYRGSLIMGPVWHAEQSLTGSHTKVILVNTVADTAIDLSQLGRGTQKNNKCYKTLAMWVQCAVPTIERGTARS